MIILLSCMTAVLPLDVSADGMADIIFAAAKAYVDIKQNEVTKEGLLAAVQAVEPTAALPQSNFYIKHAVPGVTDDDTESGYPLSIPGSDGAVAARFTVGNQSIDFVSAFAHEKEVIHIQKVAIVSEDNDEFKFDANGDVVEYTGNADKLVFPSNSLSTLTGNANISNKDGIKAIVFANKSGNAHMPKENALVGWDGLVTVDFMGGARLMWSGKVLYFTNWLHDCPELKYLALPRHMENSSSMSKSSYYNLPSLENVNVPWNLVYPQGSFNSNAVREFVLSGPTPAGYRDVQTTLLTETFLSPAYAAGTRNLITSNTTITFMQTVAMAASVLREQMALGKTGALLITDAKAALTGCAWSAASETVLDAATITMETWESGTGADQGTFTIVSGTDSMTFTVNRSKTLESFRIGYSMTPLFSPNIAQYTVTVPYSVTALDVKYTAVQGATVTITGHTALVTGENTVTISVNIAGNEIPVIYTITVIREAEPFAAAESPIYAAAQAYVDTAQNEATLEGLLAAVRAVEPIATLAQSDFYIKHAVPSVTDDDTTSGDPLSIPGSDGAVAARITVAGETIDFVSTFAHEQEVIHINKVAVVGTDNDEFTFNANGDVTGYSGDADKIVFPSGMVGTLTANANIPHRDGVEVIIFGNKSGNAHMPEGNSLVGWDGLVAVDFMGGASLMWSGKVLHFNNWIHDCPELKYLALPRHMENSSSMRAGSYYNLPSLENVNVPWNLVYPEGSFNSNAVREFVLSGPTPTGYRDVQTTKMTETFLSPTFTAGTRNIITSSTQITFPQTVAMAAAALHEQLALGKTGASLISDTKTALTGRAWSAASETVLDAVVIEMKGGWENGVTDQRGAFTVQSGNDSMTIILARDPETPYTNSYGVYDVLKTYIGSADLTKEKLLPSAGYMVDGEIQDTMFDSFIFMPSPVHVYGSVFANQQAWQNWIDNKTFASGKNVNALEAAVDDVKTALECNDYKANVFVTLVNPDPDNISNFGDLNGIPMDFTKESDRYEALKWMVDEYIATFNAQNYQHVRLAGFYWFDEYIDVNRDEGLLNQITDYIRSKGYITIFSAYYQAGGYAAWEECGFDLASMQSNYFPSAPTLPNAGGIDRLDFNVALTKAHGMGIELELDNQEKKLGITGLKQTLIKGVQTGFMNGYNLYYFGNGPDAIYFVQQNSDPYFRSLYADTYQFIKGTLMMEDVRIELME